jgi:hypothetical protein
VKDQTAGYGINEYGLAIISHDMDSWDDDNLVLCQINLQYMNL